MDSIFGSDWFDTLNATGQVALNTIGQIGSAQAQAQAAAAQAATAQALQQQAFQQNLLLSQSRALNGPFSGFSSFMSSNGLLLVMLGVVALFVINQANK